MHQPVPLTEARVYAVLLRGMLKTMRREEIASCRQARQARRDYVVAVTDAAYCAVAREIGVDLEEMRCAEYRALIDRKKLLIDRLWNKRCFRMSRLFQTR